MSEPQPRTARSTRTVWLALGLVSSAACLGYDAGIEIAVELRVAPPTARVPMGEGFATLSDARLRVSAVELLPCEDAPAELTSLRAAWSSRALAHVPDVSGSARTIDARHASGTLEGWRLRPMPGRYCALRVHLEPSEDEPSFALVGEGDAPFATVLDAPLDVDLPMELVLDAPEDGRTIAIDVDPACWLAGGPPSHAELAERLASCL
jgi:hypothetical protein